MTKCLYLSQKWPKTAKNVAATHDVVATTNRDGETTNRVERQTHCDGATTHNAVATFFCDVAPPSNEGTTS